MKPSEVFAERMQEVRERRRWSQQELADRLDELGWPTDRSTLARIEGKSRGVSLNDAVAIAAALGPSLNSMVVPLGSPKGVQIELAPKLCVAPSQARSWLRGHGPLREQDRRTYFTEVSDEEFHRMQQTGVSVMLGLLQQIVDALFNDDRESAAELVDDLNRQLARERAAGSRREKERARKGRAGGPV
jgi:transcriptional regulator with XRE-family HTH domain